MMMPPINFKKWLEENRQYLKPPVGNKMIWKDKDFIVMVVGGPNGRSDFHVNGGEEIFYQVEGDINLRLFVDGAFKDQPVREGEMFLLPPNVPHSPQRPANTIGIVVEKRRAPDELDALTWYCPKCATLMYEEKFHLTNIETQFPPVFERFYNTPERCTCQSCGFIQKK